LKAPSTRWRELIAPDEEQRFAGYARQFAEMQRIKSAKFGNGRALHRQQQLGLSAMLEVLPGLPTHARHGLFSAPVSYRAWVRLSNGGADRAPDSKPDVRGFSIHVRGVSGTSALGGDCSHQDFTLIQHAAFAFARSDEFVGLALNASKGMPALLRYLLGRYGVIGALKQLKKIARTFGKPFKGFAAETFHSAAPIACGPFAVRVRVKPADASLLPMSGTEWARDIKERLRQAPLVYELQLQFFTDEASTPIEDASVDWPETVAPYLSVARLILPQQDADSPQGQALGAAVEGAVFDPWAALTDHRPLGDVMRARKVVYFASQKERGAA
jgi:hypothetical protein